MALLRGLRRLQFLSVVLALIGLADSLYLWSFKWGDQPLVCGVGACDAVNASPYSMLMGIPVAAIGAAGYTALLLLALWALVVGNHAPLWLTDLRLLFAVGGLLFSVYLTAVEIFVIHDV